jgi:hypothetical protein
MMLSVAFLACSLVAQPAQAGHFVYGHGYYGHTHYYHGGFASFGFYGGCYAPAPVYFVPPPPVVYYQPAVVVPAPVIVQQPAVVQQAPVVQQPPAVEQAPAEQAPAEQAPAAAPAPSFVETARRYHGSGDNAGRLDWVEGLMDGRPMRIYYDDFGRVKKQKWIDDD